MAFGLLVNKWRVLKSPLQVKFANVPKVVFSCMKLHNYCISERMLENEDFDIQNEVNEVRNSLRDRSMDFSYSASMEVDEDYDLRAALNGSLGHTLREILVEKVKANNLSRPRRNLQRSQEENSN